MNQKLTDKLATLPETLGTSKDVDELNNAVVEVEREVLRSNFTDSQSGSPQEAFTARDYILGERNTRGLSWKLNLMTVVAEANFCRMVRVGIHGGQTQILGQPENIDTTIRIYESIVPVYDTVGKAAFDSFAEGNGKEEGAATPNRAGWINQYLIKAPEAMGAAIEAQRSKDAASNGKIAKMIAEKGEELNTYRASLAPAKPVKEPKAPKAPKTPKTPKGQKASRELPEGMTPKEAAEAAALSATPDENTGESADDENTDADSDSDESEDETADEE